MPKTKQPRKTAKPSGPLDSRPTVKRANSKPSSSAPELRLRPDKPYGAKHIASVVIHCAMDFDAAVRMLTHSWGLDEYKIATYVEQCESSPLVKKYIEEELSASGLDDTSKTAFVQLMWQWLRNGNEEERKKAATILGKGFIGERVTVAKPEPLPIEGLDAGVKQMLSQRTPDDAAVDEAEPADESPEGMVQ
jgi:hypothetical protein